MKPPLSSSNSSDAPDHTRYAGQLAWRCRMPSTPAGSGRRRVPVGAPQECAPRNQQ
jgi:hypothetical protein